MGHDILEAAAAAARAGQDGNAVYERLHLQWCLHDAQQVSGSAERSTTIYQCRVEWPVPVVQAPVSTNCVNYGNQVRCTSR